MSVPLAWVHCGESEVEKGPAESQDGNARRLGVSGIVLTDYDGTEATVDSASFYYG